MKYKLFSLFVALAATTALWASNVITYTAKEKLITSTVEQISALYVNAFNVTITSHEFSDGTGTITFAGEVTTIGDYAFYQCSGLTSINIPNSVTTIGKEAFISCGLTSVTIPNSVATIGEEAFALCHVLTSIDVDASNTHYCSADGVLFNYVKDTLIQYPIGNTRTEYTIPNSVIRIENNAFAGCCSSLTSITISNSVTTIGDWAFALCQGLTSITIPNSVTTIGKSAFYQCSGLTSVTIGNSVTRIGDDAFYKCTVLTSVTIPNSVKTIGDDAFNQCTSLITVAIGNSVTTIGDDAFYECSSLTTVTIGNSVTTIGSHAFAYCSGLTSITCEAITPPSCDPFYGFSEVNKSIPLYVPIGTKEAYQTAPGWWDFTNIQVLPTTDSISTNSVVIKWQKVDSAVTYTLSVVEAETADTVARYEIDSTGNIIKELRSLPHHAPQMVLDTTVSTAEVFEVSITGLSSNTTYTYSIDAKDSESTTISYSSGSFTTKSETAIKVIKEKRPTSHRPINIIGQPIDPNTHRGIYIQNGKKYLNLW